MRDSYGARAGPVRPNTTPVRDFCQLWLCQFPYVPVRASYGTLASHARAPYGSCRIWKTLKIPCGARTMPARGTRGVLRIIQPNHKYAGVSSRTGPVMWPREQHRRKIPTGASLGLTGKKSTGDKNRTGPVVGCDWGISISRPDNRCSADDPNVSNKNHIHDIQGQLSHNIWCQGYCIGVCCSYASAVRGYISALSILNKKQQYNIPWIFL